MIKKNDGTQMTYGIIKEVNQLIGMHQFVAAKDLLTAAIHKAPDFQLYRCKLAEINSFILRENSTVATETQEEQGKHGSHTHLNARFSHANWPRQLILEEVIAKSDVTRTFSEYRNQEPTARAAEGGLRLARGKRKDPSPTPLVTIVTVVYNNPDSIARCIESVLAQTYGNIEHIIIDGGSDRPTIDIIRGYESRIEYYISEPDKGIYDAMNKGIARAAGDYICLLNSDDYYAPDFVEQSLKFAIDNASAVVYSNYFHGTTETRALPMSSGIYLGHLNINHGTFLVHKAAYELVGPYPIDYKIVSDAIWMRRAYSLGIHYDHMDAALFTFSTGGLSSGDSEMRRRLFISEVVSSYKLVFPFLDDLEAEELYLLRFNINRINAVIAIAKRHSSHKEFSNSLAAYLEFCIKFRNEFKLSNKDYEGKFKVLAIACRALQLDFSMIRVPTKHGSLDQFLSSLDRIIAARKSSPRFTILHFVSVFSAPSETFIYDLVNQADEQDDLDNFVLYEHKKLETERPYLKSLWVPWNDFHEEVRNVIYEHIFRKLAPDVAVGHFALNTWKLHSRLKPLHITVPTVTMSHGIDAFMLADEGDYRNFVLGDLCQRKDCVFSAVSAYLKNVLIKNGVPENLISIVHNAASTQFRAHRRKPRISVTSGSINILSIGRLIEWKGHRTLLESLALVRESTNRDVRLTIVSGGGNDLLGELQQLCKTINITDVVSFVDFVDFQRNPDYHSKFDIFVHPSTYSADRLRKSETFGVALLEAIGAGLPVITTDAGGLPEVIGEQNKHAAIVPHGDKIALAAAIGSMIVSGALMSDNLAYAEARYAVFSQESRLEGFRRLLNLATAKRLKVALFSTSTVQGAGYAAYRLHRGLSSRRTIESTIFTTARNHEQQPGVIRVPHPSGDGSRWNWLQRGRISKPNLTIFTINKQILSNDYIDSLIKDHEIVNLHWTARFLSVENIIHLTKGYRPVVMTVRDMQPITGGCHYFHGCQEWKRNCFECPQLIDHWGNFPQKVLAAKRAGYNFDNLTLVALSNHTAEIIRQAPGFCNCRIEVIPNSIEIDTFKSSGRATARMLLGLPEDRDIICYVPSFSSNVKGFAEVTRALDIIDKKCKGTKPLVLLVGNKTPATDVIALEKIDLGYISDNARLALAYSAANVVAVPSLEETFSNTTAEALACGTPVVGFKTGAIHQMVTDGATGYTYRPGDSAGLAEGLLKVLNEPDMSIACRKYAEDHLAFDLQATAYEKLFYELAAKSAPRSVSQRQTELLTNLISSVNLSVNRMLEDKAFVSAKGTG